MPKNKRGSIFGRSHQTPAVTVGQRGLQAFQAGRFAEAITVWTPLAAKDPALGVALAEAHFRQALTLLYVEERITHLKQALALQPAEPRYRYHLGLTLHHMSKCAEASQLYRQVLAEHPTWPGVALTLALAELQQNPAVDLATLPGSTPQVCATLAPVQALLRAQASTTRQVANVGQGDTPMERLWQGLALIDQGRGVARPLLEDTRPLATQHAQTLRSYYLGVAAAQMGDTKTAFEVWLRLREQKVFLPWLGDNLGIVLQERLTTLLDSGQLDHAFPLANNVYNLFLTNTALIETAILILDRAAHISVANEDWPPAIVLWERALDLINSKTGLGSPRPLLHNLALAYEAREQWESAAEMWRAMLRTRPRKKDPEKAKETEGALPPLTAEQWAWVRKRVIECYKKADMPEQAVAIFRQAIKAAPQDLELRLQFVDALRANEQIQAALNELYRILEVDPQYTDAQLQLAELYIDDRLWTAAEEALHPVLKRDPTHVEARRLMAHAMLNRAIDIFHYGQLDAASVILAQGEMYAPTDYRFPLEQGRIALDQNRREDAERLFDRALDLGAEQVTAYFDIIVSWAIEKDMTAARAVLAKAEAVLPLAAAFYVDLAGELLKISSGLTSLGLLPNLPNKKKTEHPGVDLATDLFDRAVALEPNDGKLRIFIATRLLPYLPEVAVRFAREGAALTPTDPQALILLGVILGISGQRSEAEETLKRAARLARQQGNSMIAHEADGLRQQLDSPFLSTALLMTGLLGPPPDLNDFDFGF